MDAAFVYLEANLPGSVSDFVIKRLLWVLTGEHLFENKDDHLCSTHLQERKLGVINGYEPPALTFSPRYPLTARLGWGTSTGTTGPCVCLPQQVAQSHALHQQALS